MLSKMTLRDNLHLELVAGEQALVHGNYGGIIWEGASFDSTPTCACRKQHQISDLLLPSDGEGGCAALRRLLDVFQEDMPCTGFASLAASEVQKLASEDLPD
jgi:hypothetical protein